MAFEATEMKTAGEPTGILSLPLELRRVIILSVLRYRRPKGPVLKQRIIDGPVRLQNCFDPFCAASSEPVEKLVFYSSSFLEYCNIGSKDGHMGIVHIRAHQNRASSFIHDALPLF